MPISAYVGLTGHGKSYSAVENVILPALKNKRTVFTNIPMKTERCQEDFDHTVVQFEIQDIKKNPAWFDEVFQPGAILVLDELWDLWPAGMRTSDINSSHKEFLAKHRHLVGDGGFSTEIVLVTQDLSQLATFAYLLVDFTFRTEKLSKVGQDKRFRVDVFSGAQKGPNYPISKREREIFGSIKDKKGDPGYYYVSQTKSGGLVGDESRSDKRFNVLGGFKIKAMIFGFFALLAALIYFANDFLSNSSLVVNNASTLEVPVKSDNRLSDLQSQRQSKKEPELQKIVTKKTQANEADFVSLISDIFVTGHIDDTYYFKVVQGDAVVTVTSSELVNLGYVVEPVNPCLVKITGFDKLHFSMCQDNSNSNDFIRNPLS